MAENVEEVNKHVRSCLIVFYLLMVLTVVTVAVSFLKVPESAAITIALIIASIKGTLVCTYFMHLISEKFLIYFSLVLTVAFFLVLMILPVWAEVDVIQHVVTKSYQ